MRLLLFLITITLPIKVLGGDANSLNKRFTGLYLNGNMVEWKRIVDSLRVHKLDNDKELVLLYAEYGLIGNYIGTKEMDKAAKEISVFEGRLLSVLERKPNDGEIYAFMAAMVAFKIAVNPWKAPFLSWSHYDYLNKALIFESQSCLPIVEQANSLYFRPSIFGGDKSQSVKYYEKAFEFYRNSETRHWMYYNVGAWLGQVYAKQGEKLKAEKILLQLLKDAPDFKWVKDDLLPALKPGKINAGNFLN